MREIKFRFWVDGANGEFMIYPDNRENSNFNSEGWEFYLDDEGFEIINHRGVVEPAHHVPMQYTGLKDKNGVEIYEGDIVKYDHAVHPVRVIVFEDGGFKYKIPGIDTPHGIKRLTSRIAYLDIEVIGNKFEYPELLEVE